MKRACQNLIEYISYTNSNGGPIMLYDIHADAICGCISLLGNSVKIEGLGFDQVFQKSWNAMAVITARQNHKLEQSIVWDTLLREAQSLLATINSKLEPQLEGLEVMQRTCRHLIQYIDYTNSVGGHSMLDDLYEYAICACINRLADIVKTEGLGFDQKFQESWSATSMTVVTARQDRKLELSIIWDTLLGDARNLLATINLKLRPQERLEVMKCACQDLIQYINYANSIGGPSMLDRLHEHAICDCINRLGDSIKIEGLGFDQGLQKRWSAMRVITAHQYHRLDLSSVWGSLLEEAQSMLATINSLGN
jgi:uncharacterized protein with HEPN domain